MGRTKKYFTEEELIEAQKLYSKKSYHKNKKINKNETILSSCQKVAQSQLEFFIENDELKDFLLTGNAGTGKTFLICFIMIEFFLSKYDKIYFLAPTNKAVEVLKDKVEYEYKNRKIIENCDCDDKYCDCKKNKIEFKTTTQFLNSKERYDLKTSKSLGFSPNGYNIYVKDKKKYFYSANIEEKNLNIEKLKEDNWFYCLPKEYNENEKILLIIDECSMINDLEMNFMKKIFKNVKKIYLGDILQLPPVDKNKTGDFISEIFNENYPTFNMTTIKRTKDKDISKLYEITRDAIISKNIQDRYLSNICNKIRNNTIKKIELRNKIKQDLEENKQFIILSFRKVETNESNKLVIKCLEQNKKKEFGYFYNTQYLMKEYYNKDLKNNIYFEILNMKKIRKQFDTNEDSINVILLETNKGEITIIENIEDENIFLEWYNSKKNIILKNLVNETQKNQLIEYLYTQDNYINNTYENPLEGAIAYLEKMRRLFVPREKEIFQLCYSLTINKSQGSSYDKVYLNLTDIYQNQFLTLTNKSKYLYVGTSRAVKEIEYF